MQKKTKRIKFWLNDEELAELEQKAKKANMNRSEYMRHLIDSCQIVHAPEIDYDRYLTEFKALYPCRCGANGGRNGTATAGVISCK